MLLRGTKVNLMVSSSSVEFTKCMIPTYCVDDLVEVEEHSCVTVCTANEPKPVTKSSYDTLNKEKGERRWGERMEGMKRGRGWGGGGEGGNGERRWGEGKGGRS